MKPPHYRLTLRALPGNWRTGPEQRLRIALKVLLRGFGLRCVDLEPLSEPTPRATSTKDEAGKGQEVER
jgi:hypothetical protein